MTSTSRVDSEPLFLEPLTSKPKKRPFLVYDIESKDGDTQGKGFTRPFLVGAYDGGACRMFRNADRVKSLPWRRRHVAEGGCIDRLMRWLLAPKHWGWNAYAHNGGNFDHLHLLPWLREHDDEFQFEIVPVQSTVQMIKIWIRAQKNRREKGKRSKEDACVTLLDSMRLLPMSLQKAAKAMGLKGKEDMDLDAHEEDPRWKLYLRGDCVQLYETMKRTYSLVEDIGGEVGITAPSTAMKIFRRKFQKERIPIHRRWPDGIPEVTPTRSRFSYPPRPVTFHEWIRRGFCGGRTEPFVMRAEHLRYYDFNSSYVSVMRYESFPAGMRVVVEPDHETGQARLDWRMLESNVGFVECTVRIPDVCRVPPLPYKDPVRKKLLFPTGTFQGVFDADELKLLFEPQVKGEILDVRRVVWIERKKVFEETMDFYWSLRDKSREDYDEGKSALGKLFGNGSFGKYGQKEERKRILVECKVKEPFRCILCGKGTRTEKDQICSECEHGAKLANPSVENSGIWYKDEIARAPYIIPQIAAHVTALARVKIWHEMVRADELGVLAYSDTDSILSDADLPCSNELGKLKDEYPGRRFTGTFVQPKVYLLETEDGKIIPGEHLQGCSDKACRGCSDYKVAMKGFPKRLRTRENVHMLARGIDELGKVDDLVQAGTMTRREASKMKDSVFKANAVTYQILQKVRGMAREEQFRESPKMVDVKKGFRSAYDKRIVMPDGTTKPIVLSLPEVESNLAAE